MPPISNARTASDYAVSSLLASIVSSMHDACEAINTKRMYTLIFKEQMCEEEADLHN